MKGETIGLGGDGRYYNKEAAQQIIKLAAGVGGRAAQGDVAACISTSTDQSRTRRARAGPAAHAEGVRATRRTRAAAGNGFGKVVVGADAIVATPAMSAIIRRRSLLGAQLQPPGAASRRARRGGDIGCGR